MTNMVTERKNGNAPVTMAEIAKQLSVSTTTVSKALRGEPGIGKDTCRRVQDLAKQLGYRPNIFARGLKMSKSTTVGLLITSDIVNPWYAQLVSLLEEKFSSYGYTVMLGLGNNKEEIERRYLDEFMGGHVAGIIAGPVFRHRDLQPLWEVSRSTLPMVLFSCLDEMPVNYVTIDHVIGVKMAIRYLVECGHRRIGYLCCPPEVARESGHTRKDGFEAGMFENNLPLFGSDIIVSEATFKNGFDRMLEVLDCSPKDRPTAFFCHNDSVALGAISAVQRAGLSVPNDISLIGYDGIDASAMSTPGLTTIGNVMEALVSRLVEVLIQNIEDSSAELTKEYICPKLIERDSVAMI